MNIEPPVLLDLHGQTGEECAALRIQGVVGPFQRGAGVIVHAGGDAARGGLIVVAQNGERALLHGLAHLVDHIGRVRAIAHEVPQKHEPIHLAAHRMGETGVERLPVAVDV